MTNSIIAYVLNAKKIVVYVIGLLVQLGSLGLVPAQAQPYVAAVVAIATGLGIYRASNEPLDPVGDHGV